MIVLDWESGPQTRADLQAEANPSYAYEPECMPWALYDTQNITNGLATSLNFFTAANADKTLSNMEGPGQLPNPQYFVVHYVACDLLQIPVYTAAASEPNQAIGNLDNILKTVRTTFTFFMSNKNYGPYPLAMTAATGGETGFGYGYGAAALGNGNSLGVVNNGVPGSGGFPVSGAWVIPPLISFSIQLNFSAATTLSATVPCRMVLVGTLYRRVL